ncbi:hypothetical protein R1sor_007001 [Riccia sorocarpa]|uniref:Reverse transcriptase zinc-binding domain-containing protein n=1 Tax=Riccia sorocarpa TaxID=122646 RepID=A0ABD3HTE4_9MARC
MAPPVTVTGRGGKTVAMAKPSNGLGTGNHGKLGHPAPDRQSPAQATAPVGGLGSPTRAPMDYRAAISPAKQAENFGMMSPSGAQLFGSEANFQDALEDINYGRTAYYNGLNDGVMGGQTQDIAEKHRLWGLQNLGYSDLRMMDREGQLFDHVGGASEASLGPTQDEEDTAQDIDEDNENTEQQLPAIPESGEQESDTDNQEEEEQENNYMDRHKAWIHVLDENLAINKINPATKEASKEFELDMSKLLTAVDDIIETSHHEGAVPTETLYLDTRVFAEGINQLQKHSLIIHTVDLRVTMSYFERWAEVTLHQLLGVKVVNMCQLDPFCFHVTVESGKAKAHIFTNSPLKMGNKMVFPLPWDTRFSTKDLKSRAVPVWLELFDVHPGLMKFGLNMLRTIGPIIYAAKNSETQRINIVPRAFRPSLSTGDGTKSNTKTDDRREADTRRAKRRTRPRANGNQGGAPEGGGCETGDRMRQEGAKIDEFKEVRRRNKPKFQTPEIKKTMKVDNRYGVLEDEEETIPTQAEGVAKVGVRSRKLEAVDPGLKNKTTSAEASSSRGAGSTGDTEMLIREVVDLTKPKEARGEKSTTTPKTSGVKHQQEDRDMRLSSVGALMPEDSEGRKKLKTHAGETNGIVTAAAPGNSVQAPSGQQGRAHGKGLKAEGGQVVVDYRSDGWGGAALVLKPSIKIISRGVKGDGQAAWATFETQKGTAGVMSLYAPQSAAARIELWHWIQRSKLRLIPEATRFDKDTSIDLIYKAGELLLQERKKGWQPVKRRLKTMRITYLSDLQGRLMRRLKAADLLGELPDTEIRVSGPLTEAVSLLAEWVKNMTRDNRRITDPTQWSWDPTSDAKQTTWTKEIKEWKQIIIPPYQLRMKANASWGMNWDTRKWETLWKGVWQGSLFPRDKMWIWRILNKAFFTVERGATIGVTTAICKSCQQATENVDHMFLRCPHSIHTWGYLSDEIQQVTGRRMRDTSLPELLEDVLDPRNLAAAILFVVSSRSIWKHRCKLVYEGKNEQVLVKVIVREAEKMADLLHMRYTAKHRWDHLKDCKRTLASVMVNIRTRGRYQGRLRIAPRRNGNTEEVYTAEEEHSVQEEDKHTDRSAALEGRSPKENTRTANEGIDRSSADLETHQRRWWSMAQELELLGFSEMELEESQEHLLFHEREERK